MSLENCVYCGKKITTRSSEHVIQNALGGLYESEDICCPECNNFISRCIDAPFTKIFNPIIGQIPDLKKSHSKDTCPLYTGTVLYQGKTYAAKIKNGKVCSCPELSKELRNDISKIPLEIISCDFNLDNKSFQNGMAKIAFNYALDKGIDLKFLKDNFYVQKNGQQVTNIQFTNPIIPFYPLNPFDEYLELNSVFEPYHNLILFNQQNYLWCYVDLFNTFQYYVLLSDKIPANNVIYDNYAQTLRKLNKDKKIVPKDLYKPKDILFYAQQYDIDPCLDADKFAKRLETAINKQSQKISMHKLLSDKISNIPIEYMLDYLSTTERKLAYMYAMKLYFDEEETFQIKNFRTLTTTGYGSNVFSYPYAINEITRKNQTALKAYTNLKFNRLNLFLLKKEK